MGSSSVLLLVFEIMRGKEQYSRKPQLMELISRSTPICSAKTTPQLEGLEDAVRRVGQNVKKTS
jgi:hypothetical protein